MIKYVKSNDLSNAKSSYLIEIRLSGSVKRYVKRLVFDVARTFSVTGVTNRRVVPHITILGPISTTDEKIS